MDWSDIVVKKYIVKHETPENSEEIIKLSKTEEHKRQLRKE